MNVRHTMGVLHSFSIKNIFYDKMDLRLFCYHLPICLPAKGPRISPLFNGVIVVCGRCRTHLFYGLFDSLSLYSPIPNCRFGWGCNSRDGLMKFVQTHKRG